MRRFRNAWWLYMLPAVVGLAVYLETQRISISVFVAIITHEVYWIKDQLPHLARSITRVYEDFGRLFYSKTQESITSREDEEEPDPELRGRSRRREAGKKGDSNATG